MWLGLEPEEDHDILYVVEGKWSPVCIVLGLAVVLWLVCDFTDITTN